MISLPANEAAKRLLNSVVDAFDPGLGGLPEACQSVNDASRAVVAAMVRDLGGCWLGRINRYKVEDPLMWPFRDPHGPRNFGAAFVVPCFDEELHMMLIAWNDPGEPFNTAKAVPAVDAIFARVHALGGYTLAWS